MKNRLVYGNTAVRVTLLLAAIAALSAPKKW